MFHPREAGWVGYDVNVRGERLYHAGDTDVIPEMDEVSGVDVALLPVSGTYVMTAEEAAEAARSIQPRLAVPMHWGEHIGTEEDAERFAELTPVEVVYWSPSADGPDAAKPLRDMAREDPELAAKLVLQTLPAAAAKIPGKLDLRTRWSRASASTRS